MAQKKKLVGWEDETVDEGNQRTENESTVNESEGIVRNAETDHTVCMMHVCVVYESWILHSCMFQYCLLVNQ